MPRQANQRQIKKKPEPFSGVFFQKIARTTVDESGEESRPRTLPATDHGRRVLTWIGAAVVMAVLVIIWAASLPARLSSSFGNSPKGLGLRILNKEAASSPVSLKKEATDFKNLWRTATERLEDFKNLTAAVAALKEAQASSAAAPQLTAPQIKSLKQKLETAK